MFWSPVFCRDYICTQINLIIWWSRTLYGYFLSDLWFLFIFYYMVTFYYKIKLNIIYQIHLYFADFFSRTPCQHNFFVTCLRHVRIFVQSLGCPAKPVSIRNNRKWNRNKFRHYPKHSVVSLLYRNSEVFRLNRNKKKINRNTESSSTFWIG